MTKAQCNSQSPNEQARRWRMWRESGFYRRHIDALEAGDLAWPRDDLYMLGLEVLGDGGLVVILGKRGTGKTQMAASMTRALALHRNARPLYYRLSDYYAAVKQSFDGAADPRKKAGLIPVLVLDECQERYESQFEDLELTRLIDLRYGERRATVIIANLKPDELSGAFGPSIVSRIQECGVVLECNWPSYREKRVTGKGAA